jgi:hypothetical protein
MHVCFSSFINIVNAEINKNAKRKKKTKNNNTFTTHTVKPPFKVCLGKKHFVPCE